MYVTDENGRMVKQGISRIGGGGTAENSKRQGPHCRGNVKETRLESHVRRVHGRLPASTQVWIQAMKEKNRDQS
jgi:hypothetical protein